MRNAMWVGGGITGMGEIPMLGVNEKGIAKVIRDIFRNGEKGFFYDPNDLSTMYQDAAGTVPVTAAGQPVGLMLDKSKGLVLGNELSSYSAGFSSLAGISPVGATLSLAGTALVITAQTGIFRRAEIPISGLTVGKFYKIKFIVRKNEIGDTQSFRQFTAFTKFSYQVIVTSTSATEYTFILEATSVSGVLRAYVATEEEAIGAQLIVESVSVKEVAGNHAYQSVSAARPLLGRHPISGARNLTTSSNDPSSTSWSYTGIRTANQLDSKGGYTAVRFQGPSTSNTNKQARTLKGGAHTYTVCLKAGPQHAVRTNVLLRNSTTSVNFQTGEIDLATGVITGTGWSSKPKPNGFWECTFTQHTGISAGDLLLMYFGAMDVTTSEFDIIADYMQIEAGVVSTPFQETVTLLDITEKGVPSTYYLAFDGTDDFLQTSNIDFTATDKVSLFAGVRKLSDAALGMLLEFSQTTVTNTGTFYITAPHWTGNRTYRLVSKGSLEAIATANLLYAAPVSSVIGAALNIGGDSAIMRVNGSQAAQSSADQGTGNFGNYPLYVGRRAGTASPFNGHIYGLIGVGKLVSDNETLVIERELAKRIGVTLNV